MPSRVCYVIETSPMAPWQVEGICSDGQYVYVRCRDGNLTVRMTEVPTELFNTEPILNVKFDECDDLLDWIGEKLGIKFVLIGRSWE